MPTDPIEMTENDEFTDNEEAENDVFLREFVDRVEPSPAWNDMRDALAESMWTSVRYSSPLEFV